MTSWVRSHRIVTAATALIAIIALGVAVVALGIAWSQQRHEISHIRSVVAKQQRINDARQKVVNEKFCTLLNAVAPKNAPPPTSAYGVAIKDAAIAMELQLRCGRG